MPEMLVRQPKFTQCLWNIYKKKKKKKKDKAFFQHDMAYGDFKRFN